MRFVVRMATGKRSGNKAADWDPHTGSVQLKFILNDVVEIAP
jgi:hypothetical protein